MLIRELANANIKSDPYIRDKKNKLVPGFYLATGYTRDTGLIELRYILKDDTNSDEPKSVIIQIQGSQYRYAVTDNTQICEIANKVAHPIGMAKKRKFNEWLTYRSNSNWCHFNNTFIYRYKTITPDKTVKDILDNMVADANRIKNTFGS